MADEKLKELMKDGWSWRAYGSGLTTSEEDALRDKADAVTGESSATLAGAVDALIAGFGAGGSGGLMERGEFITTSENYWTFSIPVSSKKTHLMFVKADIADEMVTPTTDNTVVAFYAEENVVLLQSSIGKGQDTNGLNRGTAYWYDPRIEAAPKTTFTDTDISGSLGYTFKPAGTYRWIAW